MRATIKDIAKAVGVNIATVSRALNDKPGVSADLRREIRRTAEGMSYLPSGHARGLVLQRTETVGLLFNRETSDFLANPFYAEVLAGIEGEVREHSCSMMFASAEYDREKARHVLPKFITEHRVDGVIVIGAVTEELLFALQDVGLPFILVDYHLESQPINAVVADNRSGAGLAVAHLLALGHRSIAFVGGAPLDRGNFHERLEGYAEALRDAGVGVGDRWVVGGHEEGGYDSALRVFREAPEVTALFACNDANALAAMRAVISTGRSVPADVSVVGFDDIAEAREAWPPLTTVAVDKRAMGRSAARRLLRMAACDETSTTHETVFPTALKIRSSTAPPR